MGVPCRTWVSLWRLTDYLGFPARSFAAAENTRDRYAEELDLSGYVAAVDTHGWYYRSPTYHRALAELAAPALPVRVHPRKREEENPHDGAS